VLTTRSGAARATGPGRFDPPVWRPPWSRPTGRPFAWCRTPVTLEVRRAQDHPPGLVQRWV